MLIELLHNILTTSKLNRLVKVRALVGENPRAPAQTKGLPYVSNR